MLSIASALPMDGGKVPADTGHAFEDPYAPMGAVVQANKQEETPGIDVP